MSHSKYSASASKRWLGCPGSIKLSEKAPIRKSSDFADEGSVAHSLAYNALVLGLKPEEFLGTVLEGYTAFPVDQDMVDHVNGYIEFIAELSKDAVKVEFEKRVVLDQIDDTLYGTCDCIIYKEGLLCIVDFKYGQGISVEARDNPQMKYYAAGANKDHQADLISMHIYQPRDPYGKPIKTYNMSRNALREFEATLREGLKATKVKNPKFAAGEYCNFCPCLPICPELANEAMAVAKTDFAADVATYEPPKLETLSSADISHILKMSDPLSLFIKSVKEYARDLIEGGAEIEGYGLKEGKNMRYWLDTEDVAKKLKPLFGEEIYETKLKSVAQLEKLGGGKKKMDVVLTDLIEVKKSAKTLTQIKEKKDDN